MRHEIFEDSRGFTRRTLVRDIDGAEMAPSGIPAGPPDLDEIDWEVLKREINNALAREDLWTWDDVMAHPVGLQVIASVVKRYVGSLYRNP